MLDSSLQSELHCLDVAAHFAYLRVLRGFVARMSAGHGFVRAGTLADFGFSPSIPFAAIVRRFHFRMLNQHE